jgi:hypothetical protein
MSVFLEGDMDDLVTCFTIETGGGINGIGHAIPTTFLRNDTDVPDSLAHFIVNGAIPVVFISLECTPVIIG